jgi:hypothetical protein
MVGGEVSPTVLGRTDQSFYFNALQKARNVYLSPQGWARRREGQRKINELPSSNPGRNIEFSFNTEQDYRLEFSAGRFDVYKDDVFQVSVTHALIAALTYDDIRAMGFTQSADTLLLFVPGKQSIRITRTSHTVWVVDNVPFENIPVFPYGGITESNPSFTLTPSATSGEITLTLSGNFWSAATHEKQYVTVNTGLVFITEVQSQTVAVGTVISDLTSTTAAASGAWTLETGYEDVWSNTRGWPTRGTFFKGRLFLAGGPRPQTVWASKSREFFNFYQVTALDGDGFEFDLDDDGVNAILDLFPGRTLQIFTTGSDFFLRSSTTKPITPENIVDLVEKGSGHGAADVRPVSIDGSTIFVERDGAVIRDYLYNDVEQSYTSNILSELSDHLIRVPIDTAARRSKPGSPTDHVFFVNTDGTVAVLNIRRQQEFLAWSLFETEGEYEDVCVVDKDVYFIVKRTINGVEKRFTEKLETGYRTDCSQQDTSGSATDSWSGFGYMDGQEVWVLGDDYVLENVTPSSGSFTSSEEVSDIEVGLFFAYEIQPMPVDAAVNNDTYSGEYRRIVYVNVLVQDTREFIVEYGNKTFRPVFRRFGDEVLDQPPQTFSGWKKIYISGLISRDPAPTFTQDVPVDFQMLAIKTGVI